MAKLTAEQVEQKKQLITEKVKQMKAIYDELVEAGAIELTDDELDGVAGGGVIGDWFKKVGEGEWLKKIGEDISEWWHDITNPEVWKSLGK